MFDNRILRVHPACPFWLPGAWILKHVHPVWACFFHIMKYYVRDWSLITGRGGGATKRENRGAETCCAPPSRQG